MNLKDNLIKIGYSASAADQVIKDMLDRVIAGEDPGSVLVEEGLSPDYADELINI